MHPSSFAGLIDAYLDGPTKLRGVVRRRYPARTCSTPLQENGARLKSSVISLIASKPGAIG